MCEKYIHFCESSSVLEDIKYYYGKGDQISLTRPNLGHSFAYLRKLCSLFSVLDLLQENILHSSEYQHSYPYDWRTNQPIILRASKQWFVNTSKVKDLALVSEFPPFPFFRLYFRESLHHCCDVRFFLLTQESLKDVLITPKSSANPMLSLLENRPYWCVSRQRVWGVPIPVFYNTNTGQPLVTR